MADVLNMPVDSIDNPRLEDNHTNNSDEPSTGGNGGVGGDDSPPPQPPQHHRRRERERDSRERRDERDFDRQPLNHSNKSDEPSSGGGGGGGGDDSSPTSPRQQYHNNRRRERERDSRERRDERDFDRQPLNYSNKSDEPSRGGGGDDSPPPPLSQYHNNRRRERERDSRERRDERDFGRQPVNHRYDRSNRGVEREREYGGKRTRDISSSPPPYHRDNYRRNNNNNNDFSPSARRSPPYHGFKRFRRDDGGYDGRRGSPRGGGGGGYGRGRGDRRFGYDYPGGYDREMGGRPGYGPDRPHGRFRSGFPVGGPPDWEAGRGGYADSSNAGNAQREGLMTYKQFIQELEDDVLPSEAERRYQEYKSEYISTQKRTYFEAHKDDEWLKNKYHPTNLLTVIERRNELARKVAKDFLLDLHSGALDMGPSANSSSINKSGQTSEPNSEDETDGGKRRRHGRVQTKDSRISAAPKAHPISSNPKRIQIDIELAQALVTKLDSEKGIEDNILTKDDTDKVNRERSHSGSIGPVIIIRGLTSVKGLEGVELLDTLLTYLWRVHGVDYYGMIETEECKGLRHVRPEGKNSDASGVEWEKKLDLYWEERVHKGDPLEIMTAKERIDASANEALDPFVRKIRDEKYGWKYGCGAKGCTKLFHAAEYVHKHLKLKHPELVMELTSKVREDIYFQNYMTDPDAPGGQPVMQQFVPKDKMQRRRPGGMDNRLKDERVNRRDRDRNDGQRFERPENTEADLDPNNEGPIKGNTDESNIENFSGQGMHVTPSFAPDIAPPPLLMPVPGAGPLGPFVPAPPEVAMRMMREQGGPTPFEAPGRNVRGAPQIILPSSFRQDPRRLRSYNDLDAPEDEVTVIDYRSL